MKDKIQIITFWIGCIFLGGYFLRIFNFPNELILVLGGTLCLVMFMQQKKIKIDIGACLLAVTLFSYYVIIYGIRGMTFSIVYIPLVIYIMTKYLMYYVKNDDDKIRILILTLIIGYSLHGMLNSGLYFMGYHVPKERRWMDIWTGEWMLGTHHAVFFLPVFALCFPAVAYFKKRKWESTVVLLVSAFLLYTSLATRSRTPILAFVIVVAVQLLIFLMIEKDKTKKLLSNRITWYVFAGMIVLLIIGFLFVKDTPVISAFIENLSDDGGILGNARFAGQRLALKQLFDYPMGGRNMDFGALHNYCHNTWLDMANAAGLIPFFAFTAYTLYTMYNLILYLKDQTVLSETKLIITGIYVAFFLFFTVEPAFDASIHYLTPWLFTNTLIQEELHKEMWKK